MEQEKAQQYYGNHRLNNLGGGVTGVGRRVVETAPVGLYGRRMPGSEDVRDAIDYTLKGDIDFGIAAIDPDAAIQMAQSLNKQHEQEDTAVQMAQWLDNPSEQEDTSAIGGIKR